MPTQRLSMRRIRDVIRLRYSQGLTERVIARTLGVSSAQLSRFLSGSLSGLHVSTYREGNELVEVLLRGTEDERTRLDMLASLAVPTASGTSIRPTRSLSSIRQSVMGWYLPLRAA